MASIFKHYIEDYADDYDNPVKQKAKFFFEVKSFKCEKVKSSNIEKIVIRKREITEITEDGIRHILEEEIESSK